MFVRKKHFCKRLIAALGMAFAFVPTTAFSAWEFVNRLDVSPVIPHVLDAFMTAARGSYEYFVGHGTGLIFTLIWGFFGISTVLYLVGMYFPRKWTEFLGFSGGGEMWDGKVTAWGMSETLLKSGFRVIIASIFLLQIKPVYITEWLVNPFLKFGAIYTEQITDVIGGNGIVTKADVQKHSVSCPDDILQGEWLTKESCDFLIKPVADLSATNNAVVRRGFEFLADGFRGLSVLFLHSSGSPFINILTGILLISAFVGCNFFMGLLVIQGIFDMGMALILYPFQVFTWTVKRSDKWFDIWPAFGGIVTALRKLVVTMIACAIILIINIAIVRALFQFDNSMLVTAAGGRAGGNLSLTTNAVDFGGHSLLWLSCLLTLFLMHAIFDITKKRLEMYAPGMSGLYDTVKGDVVGGFKRARGMYDSYKKIKDLT